VPGDENQEQDRIIGDLKQAVRALDQLPNVIQIEGHDVDVATVAAMLGSLVALLDLKEAYEDMAQVKMLQRQIAVAHSLKQYESATQMLAEATEIIERLQKRTF
jgi:hypothetical protein